MIQKLQKPIFANALLEKGARYAFAIVEKFWNVKAVVDAYTHNGDMTKNQTIITFHRAEK